MSDQEKKDVRTTKINNKNSRVSPKLPRLVPPPQQMELFHVEKQVEYQGVEMGVLENGTPYLSESGLARMCGVDRKVLNRLAINWKEEKGKPRGATIDRLLSEAGYNQDSLFVKSEFNGAEVNAYTESVCMAILEYYAFESSSPKDQANKAYRLLARQSFRQLIYTATGYTPDQKALSSWKHFHDRMDMTLNNVPHGYFSIFHEIANMIVPMIRSGVIISDKVVPDISVGQTWAKFWKDNNLENIFGERIVFDHEYPDYYPQAVSNPQPANAYPDAALGYFREWFRTQYITTKFSAYIQRSMKTGKIPAQTAQQVLESFKQLQLKQ